MIEEEGHGYIEQSKGNSEFSEHVPQRRRFISCTYVDLCYNKFMCASLAGVSW